MFIIYFIIFCFPFLLYLNIVSLLIIPYYFYKVNYSINTRLYAIIFNEVVLKDIVKHVFLRYIFQNDNQVYFGIKMSPSTITRIEYNIIFNNIILFIKINNN